MRSGGEPLALRGFAAKPGPFASADHACAYPLPASRSPFGGSVPLALEELASGIIVAHNHPSGNLTASQSDIDLTRKLKEAGKTLEIQLLDHLIVAGKKYFSFADEGLL